MKGAVLILLDKENTRPLARYASTELAMQAAEGEPEARRAPDWTVISTGEALRAFTAVQLDALFTIRPGLSNGTPDRDTKERLVLEWLSQLDPVVDRLSDEASSYLKRRRPNQSGGTTEQTETANVTDEQVNGAEAPAKKVAKKKAAKKSGAKAKATKGKTAKPVAKKGAGRGPGPAKRVSADNLGRDGTPAQFIRQQILDGGQNKDIAEAAARKFKNDKINGAYVAWYRNKMKKDGLLKA